MLGNNDLALFKHNAKLSALGLCYSLNMNGMKKFPSEGTCSLSLRVDFTDKKKFFWLCHNTL